jgi:uroporphyrin-3 C-methyltransferase
LQTADSRLARSDRPQFVPLRKVLARDIERLKGTPVIDIAGFALKLDQIIAQVDSLPLAFEERAGSPVLPAAARAEEGFWKRLASEIWGELRQLVRVRSLEQPEPLLLAPSQAFFLRENLKLRLLNARLALLSRDQGVFRADLALATAWVQRYFDVRSRPAAAALANLKQLGASGIGIDLPGISESLSAVRNYKISREKAAR